MNIEALMSLVNAKINSDARRSGVWTLGQLRDTLAALPGDTLVVTATGAPTSLASYRGYYERLAIGTDPRFPDRETKVHRSAGYDGYEPGSQDVTIAEPCTAAELIAALNLADGETFEGYKGGQYEMGGYTFVHVAEYGDCGPYVSGVTIDKRGRAVIETTEEEW